MDKHNLAQYLSRYATEEARILPASLFSTDRYQLGICLPLRGENSADVETVIADLKKAAERLEKSLLIVAVVNGTSDLEGPYRQANQELLASRIHSSSTEDGRFFLERLSSSVSVLWIDRAEQFPFSEKEGVGLARKIGCDVLCRLLELGNLISPWLWTTDADARIPSDYFSIPKKPGSAFHFRYRHQVTNFDGALALTLYEIHLRYYFLGLKWAHSPFAYPTIGSCLAIDPSSYVVVRGFPNRLAGEDFHLLNKLAKTGAILYGTQTPITLKGRFSSRVPFGTGQSTLDIQAQLDENLPFKLYDPRSFKVLKDFLAVALNFLKTDPFSPRLLAQLFNDLSDSEPRISLAFQDLKLESLLKECHSARVSHSERLFHFRTQFDALKTLRLVHALERFVWPKLFWEDAVSRAEFLAVDSLKGNPSDTLQALVQQEEGETAISSPEEDGG